MTGLLARGGFLRGVQAAKRAGGSAPLRFAAYILALESFTDDTEPDGAPSELRMTSGESVAVKAIHIAAARLTGDTRPPQLRELAQSLADRHGLRLSDVLRLDVQAVAALAV